MERKSLVEILMERDGISKAEAEQLIADTREELWECLDGTSCLDPEEVICNNLGLEPDYIFDLI